MNFFNGIGRKLSQAGQTAVQKTKDVTDVARINGIIAEEEKKINNNYYQIGKLYASIHAEDYESEFAGMLAEIKESETKICEYRQQIQDIKGVVRCERCGAEVPNSSLFCSSCGHAISSKKVNIENVHKCSGCGSVVSKNVRFCTTCGTPVSETVQDAKVIPNIEEELVKYSEAQIIAKCPTCGAELEKDSMFCSECGTKI